MASMHMALTWFVCMLTANVTLAAPHVLLSQAVKGDLLLKNIFVSNPFEADPTSSYNSTLSSKIQPTTVPAKLTSLQW